MAKSVAEHRAEVEELLRFAARASLAGSESVAVEAAYGRVLAADVVAPMSLPPFANSQMDGYAVRSAETSGGAELPVAATIPAGYAAPALAPGSAAPIMTGAMLPEGADAVVPIEEAVPDRFLAEDDGRTVRLPETPAGRFIRGVGSDIAAGSLALAAGTVLKAPQLGLLAALGLASAAVRPRLRVLLLSTGDEVVAAGGALDAGQIFDANNTMLAASLREAGCEVVESRILADAAPEFRRLLDAELRRQRADLVLTSGGISKGAFEVVRLALEPEGVAFGPVAMQPGGPQGAGRIGDAVFLGFPGNPVSCLVSFEMFLRPALTAALGTPAPRTVLRVPLADAADSPAAKHQVRRGHYDGGRVRLVGGAESHLVHAMAQSNALVHLPVGTGHAEAGQDVEIWLL
ncbi:gephyrin-like molybdotransferase Glp [Arthrobacter sp. CAU 1506]|uniref:molybdopterin molybdotransferase MoeA n=1 Tax=Arthrobacter sp. CAU 1506 TaxID=2560052 RepID=UPI001F0D917B|nr:gephyrin-like molybdotransferase Glp [Arthrobacter sp. CAU 1506]